MAGRKRVPGKGEIGGGKPGPGRPKGSKNKVDIRRNARLVAMAGVSPLEYLISVYRDKKKDISFRLDAAKAALPYVHPRMPLVVGADLADDDQIIPPYLPRRTEIYTSEELLSEHRGALPPGLEAVAEVLEEEANAEERAAALKPEVHTHKNGNRNGNGKSQSSP